MNMNIKTVVLYHRGCNDGMASAWAASKVLPEDTQFIQYQYGEDLPAMVYDKHLIVVDLSLTPEQIEMLYPHHIKSILIIDHHKTAIDKLSHLPAVWSYSNYLLQRDSADVPIWILADVGHSGAVLTWAFFNNELTREGWLDRVPMALRYIEDYDLWKFNFSATMPVNDWLLNGGQHDFKRLDEMIDADGDVHPAIMDIGMVLMKYDSGIIKSVSKNYPLVGKYKGHSFVMINSPHHLRNKLSDKLLDEYDFVCCYTRRSERTIFSLRSRKDGVDVSKIAEQWNGGGHAQAAAYSSENGLNVRTMLENPFDKPTFRQRLKLVWWALTAKNLV